MSFQFVIHKRVEGGESGGVLTKKFWSKLLKIQVYFGQFLGEIEIIA